MLARFRPRITFANVVSLLALFVALGGAALAASNYVGSNGRINGCIQQQGTLRVVKPGKSCHQGEQSLKWNQKGHKGDRGPKGRDAASMVMGDTGLLALNPGSQDTAPVSGGDPGGLFERTAAAPSIARDLYAKVKIGPPANSSLTITLAVDGTDTALTCPIPAGGTSCQDTTHQVAIPAGSSLIWHALNPSSNSAATPATAASMSMRLTTP